MLKKFGGVFGRNPVFNNLTVLGTLIANVSGTITQALGLKSNSTTGLLQVTGPGAGTTRVMTTPDANFTAARTDAAQSFTGDQTLSDGNLVIGTSGKGIDFSATGQATGMTSELLDDYEKGTWTPAWGGSTTDPTCTYSTQTGTYTKIGNKVFCWFEIATATASGGSGSLRIKGLPFSAAHGSLKTNYGVTFTTNMPEGCVASGTAVNLTARKSDTELSYLSISALQATSYILGQIEFEV